MILKRYPTFCINAICFLILCVSKILPRHPIRKNVKRKKYTVVALFEN